MTLFHPFFLNGFLSKFDRKSQPEAIVYLVDFYYSFHIHIANQNVGFKPKMQQNKMVVKSESLFLFVDHLLYDTSAQSIFCPIVEIFLVNEQSIQKALMGNVCVNTGYLTVIVINQFLHYNLYSLTTVLSNCGSAKTC